jgi:hypothetical protein
MNTESGTTTSARHSTGGPINQFLSALHASRHWTLAANARVSGQTETISEVMDGAYSIMAS